MSGVHIGIVDDKSGLITAIFPAKDYQMYSYYAFMSNPEIPKLNFNYPNGIKFHIEKFNEDASYPGFCVFVTEGGQQRILSGNMADLEMYRDKLPQKAANKNAANKNAARQEAARQEAARQEAARQEAARQEAASKKPSVKKSPYNNPDYQKWAAAQSAYGGNRTKRSRKTKRTKRSKRVHTSKRK